MSLSRAKLCRFILNRLNLRQTRFTSSKTPAPVTDESAKLASLSVKKGLIDEWGTVFIPERHEKFIPSFPKDFKEHPDRDLVNYPHPEFREYGDKVRLGFIPDSWFQAFYSKTGITGPYLFGGGLLVFLLQKEIIVQDEEFSHIAPLAIIFYLAHKLFGHKIEKYMQTEFTYKRIDQLNEFKENQLKATTKYRNNMKHEMECSEKMKTLLPEIYQENVALQLEAAYRERIAMIYTEMKRRIDYLVESEAARKRFEQKHMINWIVNEVRKSFGIEQDKALISSSIANLKLLASTA